MNEEKIGACVRMAMAKNGYGRNDLCKIMDKSGPTITSYTQGKCKNIDILTDIAKACGMTFDEMMSLDAKR